MAIIKSYTDLEQSKRLAEILPIETADMYFSKNDTIHAETLYSPCDSEYFEFYEYVPCWSLAELLNVLPFPVLRYDMEDGKGGWIVSCEKDDKNYLSYYKDNPVDTCYEMILKLHELKKI